MSIDTGRLNIAASFLTLMGDTLGALSEQADANQQPVTLDTRTGLIGTDQFALIGAWIIVIADIIELITTIQEVNNG